VGSLRHFMTRDLSSRVWMLFGAVSLVLLVACANVASCCWRANAQRQGEFSLRVALGATRARSRGSRWRRAASSRSRRRAGLAFALAACTCSA